MAMLTATDEARPRGVRRPSVRGDAGGVRPADRSTSGSSSGCTRRLGRGRLGEPAGARRARRHRRPLRPRVARAAGRERDPRGRRPRRGRRTTGAIRSRRRARGGPARPGQPRIMPPIGAARGRRLGGACPALARTAFRTGGGVAVGGLRPGHVAAQAAREPADVPARSSRSEWLPAIPDVHARLRGEPAARVADLACGAGWSTIALAERLPARRVDGLDVDAGRRSSGPSATSPHGRPRRPRHRSIRVDAGRSTASTAQLRPRRRSSRRSTTCRVPVEVLRRGRAAPRPRRRARDRRRAGGRGVRRRRATRSSGSCTASASSTASPRRPYGRHPPPPARSSEPRRVRALRRPRRASAM